MTVLRSEPTLIVTRLPAGFPDGSYHLGVEGDPGAYSADGSPGPKGDKGDNGDTGVQGPPETSDRLIRRHDCSKLILTESTT